MRPDRSRPGSDVRRWCPILDATKRHAGAFGEAILSGALGGIYQRRDGYQDMRARPLRPQRRCPCAFGWRRAGVEIGPDPHQGFVGIRRWRCGAAMPMPGGRHRLWRRPDLRIASRRSALSLHATAGGGGGGVARPAIWARQCSWKHAVEGHPARFEGAPPLRSASSVGEGAALQRGAGLPLVAVIPWPPPVPIAGFPLPVRAVMRGRHARGAGFPLLPDLLASEALEAGAR